MLFVIISILNINYISDCICSKFICTSFSAVIVLIYTKLNEVHAQHNSQLNIQNRRYNSSFDNKIIDDKHI